ncbi:MAG: TonB-dependent receptor [Opitutaceae bacterium]|nr:TonB-dependent receptor [Verrucomicrobiales bacterium]
MPRKQILALVVMAFAVTSGFAAETIKATPGDLTRLSLEELMQLEVTSVLKKSETISETPAAVYVVTQEDIHRSGVTSIPDALRMVPGLDVAGINAGNWAVSSRGFNGRFANKLLVLMDGRSVYTPLFSGVYWDVQDTLMDDIDRIEVIRGPGASLWGANAVNGVINIITKKAKDTQGGLVSGGGGTEAEGFGSVRYGGQLSDEAFYRVYVKHYNLASLESSTGGSANDAVNMTQGGFRVDWDLASINSFSFQGDVYVGDTSAGSASEAPVAGGNFISTWSHRFSGDSELTVRAYFDRTYRNYEGVLSETRNTADIDVQHRFTFGDRNEILWGGGYRFTSDETVGSFEVSLVPPEASDHIVNFFVQDDLTLVADRLHFIVGAKLEHNDYTGFEFEPSGRLLYTPDERQTIWAAAARAVRSPSRADTGLRGNAGTPPAPVTSISGNPNFESEDLIALELGYRIQPRPRLSFDVATFFNIYNNLGSVGAGAPFVSGNPPPAHLVIPLTANNNMEGETYGVELAVTWQPLDNWRLNAGYTFLHMNLRNGIPINDATLQAGEGNSPQNQFNFRSYLDLPWNLQLDTALYYVSSLPDQKVPSYVRLDVRVGWRPTKDIEVSVGMQNLLEPYHQEFGNNFVSPASLMERSIYGKVSWRF